LELFESSDAQFPSHRTNLRGGPIAPPHAAQSTRQGARCAHSLSIDPPVVSTFSVVEGGSTLSLNGGALREKGREQIEAVPRAAAATAAAAAQATACAERRHAAHTRSRPARKCARRAARSAWEGARWQRKIQSLRDKHAQTESAARGAARKMQKQTDRRRGVGRGGA
jgi:hypothetical protein